MVVEFSLTFHLFLFHPLLLGHWQLLFATVRAPVCAQLNYSPSKIPQPGVTSYCKRHFANEISKGSPDGSLPWIIRGPRIITEVLMRGGQESQRFQRHCPCWFMKRPQAKDCRLPLKGEKVDKTDFSRRNAALQTHFRLLVSRFVRA